MAVEELRVGTEALQAMSTRWTSLADALQPRSPAASAASCSSAAAVATGDVEISAAAQTLGTRVRTGAVKVSQAVIHYDTTEAGSAEKQSVPAGGPHV